jgi:hypothetical protein
MALKPFLPQLQTTFVKCLQDSTRLSLHILSCCYSLSYALLSLILRFFYVVYDYDILYLSVIYILIDVWVLKFT